MKTAEFDFQLPANLIAQQPLKKRTDSRLLVVGKQMVDSTFSQLNQFLKSGDLLVLNDTKVIPARLFASKESGGKVEVLVVNILNKNRISAMIKASKTPKPENIIIFSDGSRWQVTGKQDTLFTLVCQHPIDIEKLLNTQGHIPLPPYIKRADNQFDQKRYQSVFAQNPGAIAAPTASLHFSKKLLATLSAQGISQTFVTLNIGLGTFQPIKTDLITDHKMHSESYHIPAKTIEMIKQTKQNGGRVIAVGTTVVRTLESAFNNTKNADNINNVKPIVNAQTKLFIYPGFSFKVIDALITNFHLPRSSLLMLVAAFAGKKQIDSAYQHAINQCYRFFSYGDAMLLTKK